MKKALTYAVRANNRYQGSNEKILLELTVFFRRISVNIYHTVLLYKRTIYNNEYPEFIKMARLYQLFGISDKFKKEDL